MKILHYGIGIPPYRGGGAVDYCIALMKEQKKNNNEVFFLYPGHFSIVRKKIEFKNHSDYFGLRIFEMINPLPMTVFGGYSKPKSFRRSVSEKQIEIFLLNLLPEVVHIHTLLGLPKEFLEVCKQLSIRVVFTTHDYYGLGPNAHFYYNNEDISNHNTLDNWLQVSSNSDSMFKIYLFHSRVYPVIKKIAKKINIRRSKLLENSIDKNVKKRSEFTNKEKLDMELLMNYYQKMLELIDIYHFNSSISKEVFLKNLKKTMIKYEVINISTDNNYPKITQKNAKKIRVAYIGPYYESYKGFDILYSLSLDEELKDIITFCFFGDDKKLKNEANIINCGRYAKENVSEVFGSIDILVIASRCKETFGLIGMESVKNGCPVLCSSNAGFKDIISEKFIFSDKADLKSKLIDFYENRDFRVSEFFETLNSNPTIEENQKKILDMYTKKYDI